MIKSALSFLVIWTFIWAFTGLSIAMSQVPAGPPAAFRVPKGVDGYTVTISDSWLNAEQGYYPIQVTIATNPAKPTVRDELFTLSVRNEGWRRSPVVMSTPIVMPSGTMSVTKEIYVQAIQNINSNGNGILIEKGQFDGRFSRGDVMQTYDYSNRSNDRETTLLYLSSDQTAPASRSLVCYSGNFLDSSTTQSSNSGNAIPSFHTLVDLFLAGQGATAGLAPKSAITNTQWLHAIHPDYLPENWIGLTSTEEILVSLDDLIATCSKSELQRSNLEEWVAAGGILIVNDTKDFVSANKAISALLGPERSFVADKGLINWKVANDEIQGLEKLYARENNSYTYNNSNQWMERNAQLKWLSQYEASVKLDFKNLSEVPESASVCMGRYLDGNVVLVPSDMVGWSKENWLELRNMIALNGGSIQAKIGTATGGVEVENYEIPGVGRPPVRMFQFLITGFLLFAGPVMLLVLKRSQKMQLMFVVIPMASALVCASLILYVILADGKHRWGRVQSYTTLDHRTNMGVTHAKSVYYSGAAPRKYTYSDQVMVFAPAEDSANLIRQRFNQEQVEISGGKIRARTPHQITTISSRSVSERLIVSKSDEKTLVVQNRLGGVVLAAVIRTEAGFFLVENLAESESKTIGKMDFLLAGEQSLEQVVNRLAPKSIDEHFGYARQYSYTSYSMESFGEGDRIYELIRERTLSGILDEPNTYIAILEDCEIAKDQIEDVNYKLKSHVIRGKW